MAPVVASRQPHLPRLLSILFAVTLLLCVFCQDVSTLIVYNRQALYNIKALSESLSLSRQGKHHSLPPVFAEVPVHLLHFPCALPRKKRFRRRGKRGGVIVKFKAYLATSVGRSDARLIHDGRYFPAVKRALHMRGCWIRPVLPELLTTPIAGFSTLPNLCPVPLMFPATPSDLAVEVPRWCCQLRARRDGVTPDLLRPLKRAASPATEELELRMALLNTRSLVNKTFLLNDFFTSRDLDFMLLTETWLRDENFKAKYLQLLKLGEGGYRTVYAGERKTDNLPVAIKHIPKAAVQTRPMVLNGKTHMVPLEVLLMLRVACGAGSLGKHAAVSLLDWYDLGPEVLLVMERPVPCEDLLTYFNNNNGFLREDQAKNIMKQLVEAAVNMHSLGVFHRDIKAENVLVDLSSDVPRVRIIDFGCACLVTKIHGSFSGTDAYIPPEVYRLGTYEAGPSTVWQLGALLYQLVDSCNNFTTRKFLRKKITINTELSKDKKPQYGPELWYL
ncbi:serine/threonine-protein kinase Chk2-like [Centropristis striata]|uniref:serine/threonine-protein kinase Chk2-like n=1 Tax=Centropristis striata TaxID=184440 RepID=UPI0027E21166|nr:serine/threonine-protein kinase Chk2-like [Centropristis striata]